MSRPAVGGTAVAPLQAGRLDLSGLIAFGVAPWTFCRTAESPAFSRARLASPELNADGWCRIYVPKKFGHRCRVLEPDTEPAIEIGDRLVPEHERGAAWNEPVLDIK